MIYKKNIKRYNFILGMEYTMKTAGNACGTLRKLAIRLLSQGVM